MQRAALKEKLIKNLEFVIKKISLRKSQADILNIISTLFYS